MEERQLDEMDFIYFVTFALGWQGLFRYTRINFKGNVPGLVSFYTIWNNEPRTTRKWVDKLKSLDSFGPGRSNKS